MSILLNKMNESDYTSYLSIAIKDYADDKVSAGTWSSVEAMDLARESFAKLLPAGIATKNEQLYTIVSSETMEKIGHLWVHLAEENHRSTYFIYDFIIFEAYRNNGFGRKTLEALFKDAKEKSIDKIDLHVFAHNKGAWHLYESMGFDVTDISMTKIIKQ